jgi:hypothetical protein
MPVVDFPGSAASTAGDLNAAPGVGRGGRRRHAVLGVVAAASAGRAGSAVRAQGEVADEVRGVVPGSRPRDLPLRAHHQHPHQAENHHESAPRRRRRHRCC